MPLPNQAKLESAAVTRRDYFLIGKINLEIEFSFEFQQRVVGISCGDQL
jgi:hypothetical protein